MPPSIAVDRDKIESFCRRHDIRSLSLFGSVLREDFDSKSDVDVLVDFQPGSVPGFLRLYSLEEELSALFDGRRVDLVTVKFLNRRIRARILASAEVQYAEG